MSGCLCAGILQPSAHRPAWAEEAIQAAPDARAGVSAGLPAAETPPPAAPPMSMTAKAHYDRGLELYSVRRYLEAIAQLDRGFAIEPRREFLFALAQAWRLVGDCARATVLYHRFIESGASPLQAEAARLGLDRCGPDRSPAPPPQPQLRPSAPSPVVVPPPPVAEAARMPAASLPPRWWRDGWGDLSLATGAIALGVAGGFYLASNRARDAAASASTEPEFGRLWTTAQDRREIAVGALVGGAVLVAVGASRLLYVRHESDAGTASHHAGSEQHFFLSLGANAAALLWWDRSF